MGSVKLKQVDYLDDITSITLKIYFEIDIHQINMLLVYKHIFYKLIHNYWM